MAQVFASLYLGGMALAAGWAALPHPAGLRPALFWANLIAGVVIGLVLFRFDVGSQGPWALPAAMTLATALITVGNVATGQPDSALLLFYLWPIPFAVAFFSLRVATVQALWVALNSALLMLLPLPGVSAEQPLRLPGQWLFLMTSAAALGGLAWGMRRRLDRHDQENHHILALSRAVDEAAGPVELRRVLNSWDEATPRGTSLAALLVATRSSLHHQEAMGRQQLIDPITGLGNRVALSAKLATTPGPVSVLTVGINRWGELTDAYGLDGGDEVTRLLCERLSSAAPRAMLFRVDCDSFAVLVPGTHGSGVRERAERIRTACARPLITPFGQLHLSISLGATSSISDRTSPATLIDESSAAKHEAERRGEDGLVVGQPELQLDAKRRLVCAQQVRTALATEGFELHYQPIVDLTQRRVVAVEALLRWRDGYERPEPAAVIALAESSGLMPALGDWVLRRALQDSFSFPPDIQIWVNVSPSQLGDTRFAARVASALAMTGVPGHRLRLEVTESVALDSQLSAATQRDLDRLGVSLVLDDLGAGFASLSMLARLNPTEVKVDRELTAISGSREGSGGAIMRSIIALGAETGFAVVAEGVEDAATLRELSEAGCTMAQGFHLARPAPPDQVIVACRQAERAAS